jgi:hypothetical protein
MDSQSAKIGENKFSPTEISKLALQFLELCGSDSHLMKRVYTTSLSLLGISEEIPLKESPRKEVTPSVPKELPPSQRGLTPEEVKLAKEDFRKRNEIKGNLTPEQAKMAKALFRQKLELQFYSGLKTTVPVKSRSASNSDPKGWGASSDEEGPSPKKVTVKKAVTLPSERKPNVSDQLPDGSRKTWATKLKMQRQRALERSIDMQESEDDCIAKADYYNSRVTLSDTWNRFQNTYDCSGKKDPLKDLPPAPDLDELRREFKKLGHELRTHTSGQIILQDELSGMSLRKK